jgi:hypothetical protein
MIQEAGEYELPGPREAGKAMVYVVRPSSVGALIRFNVYVGEFTDEFEAGSTRGNQHLYFTASPGELKVFSQAENKAEIPLVLKADSTYFIRQDAKMGIIMARNSLTLVDSVEGKYHVKKTGPGTIKRRTFP